MSSLPSILLTSIYVSHIPAQPLPMVSHLWLSRMQQYFSDMLIIFNRQLLPKYGENVLLFLLPKTPAFISVNGSMPARTVNLGATTHLEHVPKRCPKANLSSINALQPHIAGCNSLVKAICPLLNLVLAGSDLLFVPS